MRSLFLGSRRAWLGYGERSVGSREGSPGQRASSKIRWDQTARLRLKDMDEYYISNFGRQFAEKRA